MSTPSPEPSTTSDPIDWEQKYPKLTKLFRSYIVGQSTETWETQVVEPYRQHGEKRLEFRGLATELETLANDEDECARYLADVGDLHTTPTEAYLLICGTYNELVVDEVPSGNEQRRKGLRVKDAPDWAPDLGDEDKDGVVNSKQLWELQLKARIPSLPGRWGHIPISNYILVSLLTLLLGVAIAVFLPFPVISELGKVLILLGLLGCFAFALLLTTFRDWVKNGDEEEDEEEQPENEGRLRRMFSWARSR